MRDRHRALVTLGATPETIERGDQRRRRERDPAPVHEDIESLGRPQLAGDLVAARLGMEQTQALRCGTDGPAEFYLRHLQAIGDSAETVAAIVTYDEPTEAITPVRYARYALRVNGVLQPGGR